MVGRGDVRGHAWLGACVVGGMCGRGHAWWGCVAGGMHGGMCGGGGACVVGGMHGGRACIVGGMHGKWGHAWQENGNCSRQYASYRNAFLLQ